MKTITRYTALFSATMLLSGGALLAQSNASDNTAPSRDTTTNLNSTASDAAGTPLQHPGQMPTTYPDNYRNGRPAASASASTMIGTGGAQLASSLQTADYSNRSQLLDQVQQQLDSQRSAYTGNSDVDAKATQLRNSLQRARNASQDQWDTARAQLASDYQSFETSVAQAQAPQAGGSSANSTSSSTMPNGSSSSSSNMSNPNSSSTNSSSTNP